MDSREALIQRRGSTNEAGAEEALPELGWKPAAAELKDGLGFMLPAARMRANATYYGFIVLSLGLIVMIVILLHESREWRATVKSEGELWRDLVREVVHDIGFT